MRDTGRAFLLSVAWIVTATTPVNAQEVRGLWTPVNWRGKLYLPPQAVSHAVYEVDLKLFASAATQRIRLPLPKNREIDLWLEAPASAGKRGLVRQGKVDGDEHSIATFAIVGESLVGDIVTSAGKMYRLDHVGPRTVVIIELAPSKFAPGGKAVTALESVESSISQLCPRDSGDRIDAMVLYTEAACAAASNSLDQCTPSGRDAIEAKIHEAVAETNETYKRSSIVQRLSVVHLDTVGLYLEATTLDRDLERLQLAGTEETDSTNEAPYLDGVHGLREQYKADVVVMLTRPTNRYPAGAPGGFATQMAAFVPPQPMQAFAVVPLDPATAIFEFGHELGHVMGADHDVDSDFSNKLPFDFSHGFTKPNPTTAGVAPWRTVMAYNTSACAAAAPLPCECDPSDLTSANCAPELGACGCARVPYWSNPQPSQFYHGEAMGSDTANNSSVLNQTAATVANYKASSVCGDDVWMKDTWLDAGQEPDPSQAGEAMWKSPYIWIRHSPDADGGWEHQHEHQNPISGRKNWAYVKMHNGGLKATGVLELRMAKASTGLAWPSSWTWVESQQLTIVANTTRIAEFALRDLPEAGQYCLLARWVSDADPMTTPEGPVIGPNVRGNNNIIWRNVNIVDLTLQRFAIVELAVANPTEAEMSAAIQILTPPTEGHSFLDFGVIQMKLDDELASAWSAGGSQGKGLEVDGNVVRMTTPRGASLNRLQLNPGFQGKLTITFSRPPDGTYPAGVYGVDVMQFRVTGHETEAFGGVSYEVRTGGSR